MQQSYIRILIIFLSLPTFLLAAADDITYTIKPLLKQEGHLYFLSVEGTTNLPDQTLLDITFTYRFPGSENERYLDYKRCSPARRRGLAEGGVIGNVYQIQLGPFRRKPPAGEYLFKVAFDPARQPDSVSKYLEGKYKALEYLAKTETLIVGKSTEEAGKERQRMLNIIKKEGLTLKGIFDDIKEHYSNYIINQSIRVDDIKTLRQWSKETIDKLESLVKTILLEDELRVFEMVTQAKALIENSAFLIKSFLQKQDSILILREQPPMGPDNTHHSPSRLSGKDTDEFNRKLSILNEEMAGLYKLTDKEVTKNLKELGIFSLNKDVLLETLKKIEVMLNKAVENEPLKDDDKSIIMQEIVALSRNLPDIFYDELHHLVSEVIGVIKSNGPVTKKAKEGVIQRLKTLRSEIEGK